MKNILMAMVIATIGLISLFGCNDLDINEPQIKQLITVKETATITMYYREYIGMYSWGQLRDGYPKTVVNINYYEVASVNDVIKKQDEKGEYNIKSTMLTIDGKIYAYYQDATYVYEIIK